MSSGGARNRGGPMADPDSGRSDARGYKLTALPAEGFTGAVPEFPLPEPSERELEVWTLTWRTPQACAWSIPSERWRVRTVALWCRLSVRCEDPDVGPGLYAQLHRFADQVGLTTAGLAEMGWSVAVDEVAKRSVERKTPVVRPERRLRVAAAGDAQ